MDFVKEITGQKKHEEGAEGAIHKAGDKVGQAEEKASEVGSDLHNKATKANDKVLGNLSEDAKTASDKLDSKKSNTGVLEGISDKIASVTGTKEGSKDHSV